MTTTALKRAIIANPAIPDEEAAAFLASDEWRYFETYWLPLLPANVYKVITALYAYIRLDKQHWKKKESCWPSHADIAAKSGMSERTVRRILHRATAEDVTNWEIEHPAAGPCPFARGEFTYSYYHRTYLLQEHTYTIGQLLGLFVRAVAPRRRYSLEQGRWLRTSNLYQVAAILPLAPGAATDLLLTARLDEVREQRAQITDTLVAVRTAGETISVRPPLPFPCAAKLDEETSSQKKPLHKETASIVHESGRGPVTITKTTQDTIDYPANMEQILNETGTERRQPGSSVSNKIAVAPSPVAAAPRSLDNTFDSDLTAVARAPVTALPVEAILSEDHMLLIQADAHAGAAIERIAHLMGDHKPGVARRQLIRALINAHAPAQEMVNVARLARNRIERFKALGGIVPNGKNGAYFLVTARNTVAAARARNWDIALIDAEEAVKHTIRLQQPDSDVGSIPLHHSERRPAHGTAPTGRAARIRQAPEGDDHTAYTSHTRLNF